MNAMSFRDWEMRAGDPAVFAFSLAFVPNPDGADDRATAEESESWGSFTLWPAARTSALTLSRARSYMPPTGTCSAS